MRDMGRVNLQSGYFEQPIKAPNLPVFKLNSPPHSQDLFILPSLSLSKIISPKLSFIISRIALVLNSLTSRTFWLNSFQNLAKTSIQSALPAVISSRLSSKPAVKL